MPIPTKINPMGRSNQKKYFELILQPGILATDMTYSFTPYWNDGGYCSVDWGDGQYENAVTSGTFLSHTYDAAGTYAVRIKADCYHVRFDTAGQRLIAACSDRLGMLGDLTNGYYMFSDCTNAELQLRSLPDGLQNGGYMFHNCTNASFSFTSLPESLTDGDRMFQLCTNAELPLTCLPDGLTTAVFMFSSCVNAKLPLMNLPDGLISGLAMFYNCTNAEINLDTLVANAPEDGWTALTDVSYMFYNCSKVTGSRSAFLAKCPNVTNTTNAFAGTNTTE